MTNELKTALANERLDCAREVEAYCQTRLKELSSPHMEHGHWVGVREVMLWSARNFGLEGDAMKANDGFQSVLQMETALRELLGDRPGPTTHCKDCGMRMVWSNQKRDCPVWMCPNCVHYRMQTAEDQVRRYKQRLIQCLLVAEQTRRMYYAQAGMASEAEDRRAEIDARLCAAVADKIATDIERLTEDLR